MKRLLIGFAVLVALVAFGSMKHPHKHLATNSAPQDPVVSTAPQVTVEIRNFDFPFPRELPEPCLLAILAALRGRGKALAEMAPDEPLFDVSPHGFYLNLRRYLRKAGLPESGVHVLRHSAAKLRRDVGESIEAVSRFLDHANLAVTTTYLRRLEGEEDTGWRKVAALLD